MTALSLAGCYTALVTPFRDGRIDWDSFRRLIEDQIQNGIDGLVPMGTTGESPTVTMEEHKEVIRVAVETVNGRCPVIAGTGANNTEEAIELTRYARAVGADATLQVTPYYNKPSQEGLYRHFSKVADDGQLPVVLYNVPGRTGREIAIETVTRLARNTNIIAIKEAAGSVDRVAEI
ncbi:MAG: 4-hydroxy-tetrahydrodipicolinate synthase, partial [Lentisphaerae bacterium]